MYICKNIYSNCLNHIVKLISDINEMVGKICYFTLMSKQKKNTQYSF